MNPALRLSNNCNRPRLPRQFAGAVLVHQISAACMFEQGHCAGVMVEGRAKRSGGTDLKFLTSILMERGCKQAFNLVDGGRTSAMVFMGDLVMEAPTYNGFTNTRRQPDINGIGTSPQVKGFIPRK